MANLFKTRSKHHRIYVEEKGNRVILKFNNMVQTAVGIDESCVSYLAYINYLHLPLALKPDAEQVLIIGLGGRALPRRMLRDYPGMQLEVVEIDPVVVDVARRYFNLPQDPRLSVIVADGREYLASASRVYDLIISDAFQADSIPTQLTDEAFFRQVKLRLRPDGVLAYNVVSALQGSESAVFKSIYQNISAVWRSTYVFPVGISRYHDPESVRNIILLATDCQVPAETLKEMVENRAEGRVSIPGFPEFAQDLYRGRVC